MRSVSRSRRAQLTVVCLATIAAAGCGKGDSTESQAQAAQDSPLGELFGWNFDPAESRKKDLEMQESIQLCMRDAGFEYIPVDWQAQQPEGANEQWENPEEFGKKYGYGIVYNYNLYERPGAEQTVDTESGAGFEDPNWEYQQSLSPDDQTAYQEALSGDPAIWEEMSAEAVSIDETSTDETVAAFTPPPLEEQGCQGKAQKVVYGDSPYDNPDLSERLNEMYQQMESDPRIEDAVRMWSDCVYEADAAWDFVSPDAIYSYFENTKQTLQGMRRVELDPETGEPYEELGENEYVNWSTQDENGDSYGYVGEPKVIPDADLDEMQKEEIDLFKVDQGCQKDAELVKIRKDIEQEMADTLTAEFPELGNKADTGS